MSLRDDYENRNKKGGYTVPMSFKKYKEWSNAVKESKNLDRHSSQNLAESKNIKRPD